MVGDQRIVNRQVSQEYIFSFNCQKQNALKAYYICILIIFYVTFYYSLILLCIRTYDKRRRKMQMPRDREKVTNAMRMQVILNSWLSAAMKDPKVDDLPTNFSSQNQVYSDRREASNADLILQENL